MSVPPPLTDHSALALHRARARATLRDAQFLHYEALAQVKERLEEVNRTFKASAIVTAHSEFWTNAVPDALIIAPDETLALTPGAFDLVIHAMALHWADDPVGQLVQARRALKPDGLFLGVFPGGQTLHELRAALAEAESTLRGGLSPRIAPMGEIRELGALLQRAGFALPVADTTPLTVTYKTALHLMHDLRAMGESNALAARDRRFAPRALFSKTAEIYHTHFATNENRVRATFDLVFLTGWAPDDSQQKPMRPGSAKARLADALGVDERPARDPATPGRD